MNKFLMVATLTLLPTLAMAESVCHTQKQLLTIIDIGFNLGRPYESYQFYGDLPKNLHKWKFKGDDLYEAWMQGVKDSCDNLEKTYIRPIARENSNLKDRIKELQNGQK